MRKRLLLVGLVLLLALPLALVLRSFARNVILVSVLHILWPGYLLLQSIPQALLWTLLLTITLLVSVRSLSMSQRSMEKVREVGPDRPGQVSIWAERIHMMSHGSYYEWSLAQHLGRLFLSALAYRDRLSRRQIRQHLQAGKLDAPPEIRAYLEAALGPAILRPVGLFSRLMHRLRLIEQTSPLDLDPERVVLFLEEQTGGST